MRKYFIFLLCFGVFLILQNVSALESDRYYLPSHNTYYTRSQHTYSYTYEGTSHRGYIPANYTLIKDLDETYDQNDWSFTDKYPVLWTSTETSYNVSYCADVLVTINPGTPY